MSNHTPRKRLDRRTALKGIAMGGLAAVGLVGTAAAKPGGGPPGGAGADVVVPEDEASIQAGVDAASPGDTVLVKGGTYVEQVVIDEDLTLRGVDDPTIRMPADPGQFTIPETGAQWAPVVIAYGGTEAGGTVSGADTIDVTLTGFEIDGDGHESAGYRAVAIFLRNVTGTVSKQSVVNMGIGGGETFGIIAYGDSDLRVHDNEIYGYERGGIGANGDGGEHPSPAVDIRDNLVIGSTGIGEAWGSNGIQVGYGAAGRIVDNEVRDNRYAEEAATASGIIVFETDEVQVRGNKVVNNDAGIAIGSWGWFRSTAVNNKIMRNEIHEANAGVSLESVSYPGFSGQDVVVDNNKVVNNAITDPDADDPDTGIAISVLDAHPDYTASANNNKVIRNTVSGFATQVDDSGTDTKLQAIEP